MLDTDTRKRYQAFWEHEAYERCCLYLTAPKKDVPQPMQPEDVTQKWEDVSLRTQLALDTYHATNYMADAVGSVFVNFGPGCLTSCIGGTHKWMPDTVWFENQQVITDWDNTPDISFRPDSDMARLIADYTDRLLEAGAGKFYTSITDIGGTYDIVAALRGTQTLLVDLIEYPEQVKAFIRKLQPVWRTFFETYMQKLMARQGAVTSWMPIYSDRSYYPLQCDFSAMISPDMFEEFVLPDLQYQTSYMERSIYHWDGPGELPHLEHLLSLERLSAIQWVPGDGAPNTMDECWYEYYQKIQRAGKSLVISWSDPAGIEKLLKHISTKGLFLQCHVEDEKQAAEVLAYVNSVGVK